MKKLLVILAVGTFAACNSGESTSTTDSTSTVAPATVDTSATMGTTVDTSATMGATVDTTKADTTHK